jgi:hypothetical protein
LVLAGLIASLRITGKYESMHMFSPPTEQPTNKTNTHHQSTNRQPSYHSPNPQHCVYSRADKASLYAADFIPHSYCNSTAPCAGEFVRPFGSSPVYSYDFLTGWRTRSQGGAWSSDMAVITLSKDMGGAAGTMGFAYSKKGFAGPVGAAGYPAELFGESTINVRAGSRAGTRTPGPAAAPAGSGLCHRGR